MRWRLSRLDIYYGIGELLIVIVGVLIALAVDGWNSNRLDRIEEAQAVDRLISDLSEDLERLGGQASAVEAKEASLARLRSVFDSGSSEPADRVQVLQDVIDGADYGRNQVEARRTTFSELLGSGRFSLIRDPTLRENINEYYDFDASVQDRIDARETDYPRLAYLLVPRQDEGSVVGARGEAKLDSTLTEAEIESLVSRVLGSELGDQLTGEINLARYIRNIGARIESRCRELIAQLETYREEIT